MTLTNSLFLEFFHPLEMLDTYVLDYVFLIVCYDVFMKASSPFATNMVISQG